jgi:hypothetical protein
MRKHIHKIVKLWHLKSLSINLLAVIQSLSLVVIQNFVVKTCLFLQSLDLIPLKNFFLQIGFTADVRRFATYLEAFFHFRRSIKPAKLHSLRIGLQLVEY